MTDKLPPPLLALFQPRPPLRYVTPLDRAPEDVKKSTIGGIADFLPEVKKYEEEIPYNATDSWIQRKWRQKAEQKERLNQQLTEGVKECKFSSCIWSVFHLLQSHFCSLCNANPLQTILRMTSKHEEIRSRRFSSRGLATILRSPI